MYRLIALKLMKYISKKLKIVATVLACFAMFNGMSVFGQEGDYIKINCNYLYGTGKGYEYSGLGIKINWAVPEFEQLLLGLEWNYFPEKPNIAYSCNFYGQY